MKKEVEFKSGKEVLRGTLFTPTGKGSFPGVVFYHGRGSDRTRYLLMAEFLANKGMIALVFDFGGCGKSSGVFANQTHRMGIEDGRAALEFLLNQNIDKVRMGIQGTSFGGYVTGMLLKDYDFIKSVVLRVPASYSDKYLETTVAAADEENFFAKKENWIDSSSYNGLANFRGNLLVIRSEKDQLIPQEEVNRYYDVAVSAKKRKLFVHKNAGHDFSNNPIGLKEFQKITEDWFLETL
ncbi:MAG: prolyl oligopeptidase family serine peptidase [Candidatus Levybacteria bacterium]|nr:prolyl oligopeptidase family serine peptidase [Candidatus Levybacteria bacterium]